jgi:hypothetical protein
VLEQRKSLEKSSFGRSKALEEDFDCGSFEKMSRVFQRWQGNLLVSMQ